MDREKTNRHKIQWKMKIIRELRIWECFQHCINCGRVVHHSQFLQKKDWTWNSWSLPLIGSCSSPSTWRQRLTKFHPSRLLAWIYLRHLESKKYIPKWWFVPMERLVFIFNNPMFVTCVQSSTKFADVMGPLLEFVRLSAIFLSLNLHQDFMTIASNNSVSITSRAAKRRVGIKWRWGFGQKCPYLLGEAFPDSLAHVVVPLPLVQFDTAAKNPSPRVSFVIVARSEFSSMGFNRCHSPYPVIHQVVECRFCHHSRRRVWKDSAPTRR